MKEWDDLWQTGATKVDGVTCYKLTGAVSDTPPHAMGQGVKGPSLYSVTIGSQVPGSLSQPHFLIVCVIFGLVSSNATSQTKT